tara:strand:+ start:168 stop:836 length:669 start_codon:yes stop_codon:yes gene_type:complete
MRIDIVSDVICPWCFIGKRRLERALAARPDLDPEIHWRPFQLNPDMPAEGLDRRMYLSLKFGGEKRADQIYQAVAAAAESEGLNFALDKIVRTPNTITAHRLIRYADEIGKQGDVVEALFRGYFFDGRDIGDVGTLADIAGECGLERDTIQAYLESEDDVVQVRTEDDTARRMGIHGVPCFIVDARYAVSGAQDPEVFQQVFSVAEQAEAEGQPAGQIMMGG